MNTESFRLTIIAAFGVDSGSFIDPLSWASHHGGTISLGPEGWSSSVLSYGEVTGTGTTLALAFMDEHSKILHMKAMEDFFE